MRKELPVFFDQTGKRWRKTKWIFAVASAGAAAALLVLVPAIVEPVALPSDGINKLSGKPSDVEKLEALFNSSNVPVIGRGQFIRAVKVHGTNPSLAGYDPARLGISEVFSGRHIRTLTPDEVLSVSGSNYALERYGQMPERQMVLTFDDGPDPKYTPELLDILSKNKVPAAFFVVGTNVVKHPEVAHRAAKEGHLVANHTFSHIDFEFDGTVQGEQEINQTARVLQAATERRSAFIRVPYAGNTDEAQRDNIKGILQAQRLGYVAASFDYDTSDWKFKSNHSPNPNIFDGSGKILLMHDSGGDRSYTINYVKQLIPLAKQAGYSFTTLDQVHPGPDLHQPVEPSFADKVSLAAGQSVLVTPIRLVYGLFAFSVVVAVIVTGTNIVLAFAQRRRSRRVPSAPRAYRPGVSVVIPAYNEESVLEGSVRSILASRYKNLEVIIVDDGSRDDTFRIAQSLAARYPRVRAIHQRNRGKSAALNNGIRHSSGEVIVCVDADTVFVGTTVSRLARHFRDPRVGAVAGYVRVGNIRNLLTRWQALEYITSIALERSAQAFLGAITVVPGACGAWRRQAIRAVGGFSDRTLAEDCDVALSVQEAGYRIVQDSTAVSYTECPLTLGDLAKQRFRWTFGNIQSYWKHRKMFFNKSFGWLGTLVLPNAALSILMPMLFWPLLLGVTAANVLAGRWWAVILFPLAIMIFQFFVAWVGLILAREKFRHLLAVPLTRLVYGPLRTYILYRSVLTALKGVFVGWNKFGRTKTVSGPGHAPPFRTARQSVEE